MRTEQWTRILKWGAAFVAFVAIMVFRRPDQFLHPYVWVEEGRDFLPQYIQHGWRSIFMPVAGYIQLPSKVIFAAALKLSFAYFPIIAYWLTMVFEFLVCVAVVRSPTYLRLPWLCAAALMLVPINSEVYAVSEYAFWFGAVLLFLSVLWTEDAVDRVRVRSLFTFIGGMSSPMTVALAPLFVLRALSAKDRREDAIALIAMVTATIQAACMYVASLPTDPTVPAAVISLPSVLAKFFGWYAYFPGIEGIAVGAAVGLVMLVTIVWALARERSLGLPILIVLLVIAVIATLTRVPLQWVSAYTDGPRYFFYPYLFLGWLLIYAMATGRHWQKIVLAALLLCSLRQTYLYGQRRHDAIDWSREVAACVTSEKHLFPVHYIGDRNQTWHVELTGNQCRRLAKHSASGT